jgi:peptidoglycan/LPS O-acetylase OafA/YrhL
MVLCSGSVGAVSSVLSSRVLVYLGRISYSVYLWQELATSELFRKQPLVVELAAVVGVFVIAAILFEVLEKPLIDLGRRLARTAVPIRAEAASARV